jgi:hypothetical protein
MVEGGSRRQFLILCGFDSIRFTITDLENFAARAKMDVKS